MTPDHPAGRPRGHVQTTAVVVSVLALGLLSLAWPADVAAQSRVPLSVGVLTRVTAPSDDDAASSTSIGLLMRFGTGGRGWSPHVGFGWHTTVLEGTLGPVTGDYAEVRIRPVLVGAAYTWSIGGFSVQGALGVGLTFNDVTVRAAGQRLFGGASGVDAEITNTLAVRPRVRVWHDLNDKTSWMVGAGLVLARPEVTFRSATSSLTRPYGRATFALEGGVAYKLF